MSKKIAENGSFVKPTKSFSQISNSLLQDNSISLKAKGLYSLIVSYVTIPNFVLYKAFLQSRCSEGRCAFDSAWNELKDAGYLSHSQFRQNDGTFGYIYSLTSSGEVSEFISAESSENEKEPMQENHTPDLLYINNNLKSNRSLSVCENKEDILLVEKIKEQINYEYFENDSFYEGHSLVVIKCLIAFIAERIYSENVSFLINSIDCSTICDFLEYIKTRKHTKIRNQKAYWQAVFWNYLKESSFALAAI